LEAFLTYATRDGKAFSLNGKQRAAIWASVSNQVTVITGGPGTGKTTIVCSLLRALLKSTAMRVHDIALAAPTGRAAQHMGEALAEQCRMAVCEDARDRQTCKALETLKGQTLHGLLGGTGMHGARSVQQLGYKIVVVDECSMVDLFLMRALLRALPADCRLVFLGDRHQLPSVEAGAVLGDLTEIMKTPAGGACIELDVSCRFTGHLRACAEAFNRGESAPAFADDAYVPRREDAYWTDVLKDPETRNRFSMYALDASSSPEKRVSLVCDRAREYGFMRGGAVE
jgi:exodeoxyribonuclease V alpha subunit